MSWLKFAFRGAGLTGTVVDPKIVFGRALAMRAAALVLVHNRILLAIPIQAKRIAP